MAEPNDEKQNTDRELFCWQANYHEVRLFITAGGEGVGIDIAGHVIVKPVEEWFRLANGAAPGRAVDGWDSLYPKINTASEPDRELSAREIAIRVHDFPKLMEFFEKHAFGPKMAPSCLTCGHTVHDEPGIKHLELPGIVICKECTEKVRSEPSGGVKGEIPYEFRERYACKVCGNVPDSDGWIQHGKGCYTQDPNGGGSSFVELPSPPPKTEKAQTQERERHQSDHPQECPITGRPFFMTIEHPELGMVATYGGPFDSYTIPYVDDEETGDLRCERYDHDAGYWVEGGEPLGLMVVDEDELSALTSAKHSDGERLICPACEVGTLKPVSEYSTCDECGTSVVSPEQARIQDARLKRLYGKDHE